MPEPLEPTRLEQLERRVTALEELLADADLRSRRPAPPAPNYAPTMPPRPRPGPSLVDRDADGLTVRRVIGSPDFL